MLFRIALSLFWVASAFAQSPIGYLDSVNSFTHAATGWACDPLNPSLPVSVHIYASNFDTGYCFDYTGKDQPARRICLVGAYTANQARESGVGAACGGNSNHGFSGPLPATLFDGGPHYIYLFPVDPVTGTGGAPGLCGVPDLCGSPKLFQGLWPVLPPVTAVPVLDGRIGVRLVNGFGQLYNRSTGAAFVPRGNNYIRVVNDWHSTFTPSLYDSAAVESALTRMQSDRYNVVRVFLDYIRIQGNLTQPGLDPAYMSKVFDFMTRARNHGIRVILTGSSVPSNYASIINAKAAPANVQAENLVYMHPGYIDAYKRFLTDLAKAVKSHGHQSTLFSYDLWNEPFFATDRMPFSLGSGKVSPASGGTYDLSSGASRQALADASAAHWANQMTSAIKQVDALALVGVGVFTPRAVGRPGYDGGAASPDPRLPLRLAVLANTSLDYVSMHAYPAGTSGSFYTDIATAEVQSVNPTKPLLLGEFGAFKMFYPSVTQAAYALRDTQLISCGYRFSGWLAWTWDTYEQTGIWNIQDQSGAINGILAPIVRANSCVP